MSASAGRPLLPTLSPAAGGPDREAVVTVAGRRLSDGALRSAAAAVAGRVVGAGAVAVDATASLETVVAVVGCLLAGVPAVPVAADAGPTERDHVLADSGAEMLLTEPGRAGAVTPVAAVPVDVRAHWSGGLPPEPPWDTPALVLYTSGTTGPPKGVVIRRDAIAADLDALAAAWEWTAADRLVHGLPLFHVHGLVLGVLGALRVGGTVVHTGRPTPDAYAAGAAAGGTLFFGVPTVWSRVAASPAAPALRAARLLVSGSAALPVTVFDAVRRRCGQAPVERYGMTETLITLSTRAGGERRPGTVGMPLDGVAARVVGDGGEAVPAGGGDIGTLQVAGPTLMSGYLGQPEATAACYGPGGWFVTGDAATVDGDGFVRIVGRESSDLIKTGGFRVGAGEVESVLLAHPAVREAAVVGEADDDLGQVVVAYVVADGVGGDDLSAWVAGSLSLHKRPRRVELVASLPRNAMGKVRKADLGR